MDFFTPSSPAYKTVVPSAQVITQPTISSSLTGMLGSVLGRATPVYKTVDGQAVQVQASSGLWSLFGVSSPSYKTAPVTSDVALDEDDCAEDSDACDPGPDNIVVL